VPEEKPPHGGLCKKRLLAFAPLVLLHGYNFVRHVILEDVWHMLNRLGADASSSLSVIVTTKRAKACTVSSDKLLHRVVTKMTLSRRSSKSAGGRGGKPLLFWGTLAAALPSPRRGAGQTCRPQHRIGATPGPR
jgi:hypothetical protein